MSPWRQPAPSPHVLPATPHPASWTRPSAASRGGRSWFSRSRGTPRRAQGHDTCGGGRGPRGFSGRGEGLGNQAAKTRHTATSGSRGHSRRRAQPAPHRPLVPAGPRAPFSQLHVSLRSVTRAQRVGPGSSLNYSSFLQRP